jgi:hypothetical protein
VLYLAKKFEFPIVALENKKRNQNNCRTAGLKWTSFRKVHAMLRVIKALTDL